MKNFILFITTFVCLTALKAQQTCSTATTISPATTCNYTTHTTTGTEYWLKFVASSPTVNISLVTVKFGINATHIHNLALYSGNCSSPVLMADDELPFVADAKELAIDLNASGLIVGQTYYLKASRLATHSDCDKTTCKANNSTDPTTFTVCVENITVIIPKDFGLELPQSSHTYTVNRGQLIDINGNLHPEIKLYNDRTSPAVYIADDKVSYVFSKIDTSAATLDTMHRVDMSLVGGNPTKVFKTEQTSGISNFYLAHTPKGVTNNKSYSRAVCNEVYPLIDMQYYSNAMGVKYYFIVKPGGDPDNIIMQFDGAIAINVTPSGGLDIVTSLGTLDFEPPHAYRINPAGNVVPMPWQAKFEAIPNATNQVKFKVHNYSHNMPLFIQVDRGHQLLTPTPATGLCWSTYFGGNNQDTPYGITNDNSDNTFFTGITLSPNFPENVGMIPFTSGGVMTFTSKFFANTNQIHWSTFYGGSDNQTAYDVKTNSLGEVYVVGHTAATDFPPIPVTGKYFDGTLGNISGDGFIVKFDNASGLAIWATFFGGNGLDKVFGVDIDNNDNVYLIGETANNINFPIVNMSGAYSQAFGGASDAFITKLNSSDSLIWNTFIGGSNFDMLSSINIDGNNNVFVSGETNSSDYPYLNPFGGAFFDGSLGGTKDQTLMKFSPSGQRLWGTYIGGSDNEFTFFGSSDNRIDFDSFNNIYLVGYTKSNDFPVFQSTGYYDDTATVSNGYIMKFANSNLARLWSSYVNGTGELSLSAIAVDKVTNNVYVAGTTSDTAIPLNQQPNAFFQNTLEGQFSFFEQDACLFGFNKDNDLILGTYFGGYQQATEGEFIMDMSIINQKLYFTGFTSAQSPVGQAPFPLFDPRLPAYYDDTCNGGSQDAFVSEICVDLISNIENIQNDNEVDLIIFPNPAANSINLNYSEQQNRQFDIYNLEGKLINSYSSKEKQITIPVQSLAKGTYLIKVISTKNVQVAKFIKQ